MSPGFLGSIPRDYLSCRLQIYGNHIQARIQQLHRSGREHTDKDDGDPRGYEGDGQYRVRPSAEVLLEAAK